MVADRTTPETGLRDEARDLLRDLIRIDTSNPPGRETPAALLLASYLEAHGVECELVARDPGRANLIARIRGSGDGPTLAFLGHTDVVPADARDWQNPPFGGELDTHGYLWGRGAVDMKNETATRAVAVAELARGGFRPRGDLLFIAQADEEDGREAVGLAWLVRERPDIRADYAIDEGGGWRLPLSDGRIAVTVNVGEKASLPATVTALGEAGHASKPSEANAVLRLAALIARIGRHRPSRRLLPETRRLLEILVGTVDGDLDAAVEHARLLHPALAEDLPPLFGVTITPTRLHGSAALNVMPARACVECDCRLLPGDGPDLLEHELRQALGDGIPYRLELGAAARGGSVSAVDTALLEAVRRFVHRTDPGALLLPTISTGFCDAHHLRDAFGTVAYGFWPVRHTPLEVYASGFHNRDERIHVDDLGPAVTFHLEVAREIGTA